jgi:hypothetical protein
VLARGTTPRNPPTGLVHLLMLGTLRPLMFFGWIVALVTATIVVFPFGTLVGGVAARSASPYDGVSRH